MTVEQSVTVPDIGKRMAEAGHLAAELRLLAVEAKDREDGSAAHVLLQSAGFLDMIATALSARDRLLAEARGALEELSSAVFGDKAGDEPDVFADYDRLSALARKCRATIERLDGGVK